MAAGQLLKSIRGRLFGLTAKGGLVTNENLISSESVKAVITVGAEVSDVRPITIQLQDGNSNNIANAEVLKVYLFSTIAHTALVTTGGSTGIAIGANGAILRTITAKKQFEVVTNAAGLISLTWTDTGTEAFVIGVLLPTGVWEYSASFANA